MAFIGRLHPLLIHFPIALVIAAALAEGAAIVTADETWRAVAVGNVSGRRQRGSHADNQITIERISIMNRLLLATGLATLTLGIGACGAGYGSSSPSGPSNTPAPAGAITIDVVRENGNQSFSPNPATVPPGQTVVWHNIDTTTHRVVLNDGELDTGNLAPGAFSQPTTIGAPSPYHCSIHPDMVGSVANQ